MTIRQAIERACLLLLAIWALAFIGRYLFIVSHTLGYSFQLEWMEGGTLDVVTRIRAGKEIYVAPSLDYVPYIYTPFYYLASTLSSHMFGVDFRSARMVSLLATLGTTALIHIVVRYETKSNVWGLLGAGVFVATYDASGKWFHLARVDSLALFWTLAAFAFLRTRGGWRSAFTAGVMAWLAVFTKQTTFVPVACVLLAALVTDRRRALIAGTTFGVLSILLCLGFEISSDGWFSYYTFWLPSYHPSDSFWARHFFEVDLLRFWPTVLIGAAWISLMVRSDWRMALTYCGLALGCLATASFSRAHVGGFQNVLMPAHLAIIVVATIGASELIAHAQQRSRFLATGTTIAVTVLLGVQFGTLEYELDPCIPDSDAEQLGNDFLAELGEIEGNVLLPDYRWLPTRAGKQSYGLGMAARDVLRGRSPRNRGREPLSESLREAFAHQRFQAVILSSRTQFPGLRENYQRARPIDSPAPITGARYYPREVWVPRSLDPAVSPQTRTPDIR